MRLQADLHRNTYMLLSRLVLLVVLLPVSAYADPLSHTGLDAGYYDMYNLDFAGAHQVFDDWIRTHPTDPLGPASDAAALLFSEFDRLHVLDVELFADEDRFTSRGKLAPNPDVRRQFEDRAAQADTLANDALKANPNDARALYVKALMSGMHANYAAMIDKKDYAALKYTEQGSKYAKQTLAADPALSDAYIAVGVENYMLSLKPAVLKFFLAFRGDGTSKEEGIRQLRLCAAKGHFLAPFARLMLAVATLRENDKSEARAMLSELAHEFPQNTLYQRQLDRIH